MVGRSGQDPKHNLALGDKPVLPANQITLTNADIGFYVRILMRENGNDHWPFSKKGIRYESNPADEKGCSRQCTALSMA